MQSEFYLYYLASKILANSAECNNV